MGRKMPRKARPTRGADVAGYPIMVKWTAHATTQLRHIHDYIAQDSPLYAKRVSDALVRKTFLLDELPRTGRKVPEFDDEAVRELSLYSYLFPNTPIKGKLSLSHLNFNKPRLVK